MHYRISQGDVVNWRFLVLFSLFVASFHYQFTIERKWKSFIEIGKWMWMLIDKSIFNSTIVEAYSVPLAGKSSFRKAHTSPWMLAHQQE